MSWPGAWLGGAPSDGGGDTTEPTITIVSYPATAGEPIILDVTDATPGIAYLAVFVTLPGSTEERTIYRRGAFRGAFTGTAAAITDGWRLTIYMAGNWPGGSVAFTVDALDGDGNDEGP